MPFDVDEIRAYYHATLPFYDAAIADRGDLPFWESIAKRWASKRVLDLGCGTGRVTEVLARHADVTAVDLLIELLDRACERTGSARFVAADLRRFAFREPFDLIILANDPMAHLTSTADRNNSMRLIREHLAAGGRIVAEGLYRPSGAPSRQLRRVTGGLTVEENWRRESEEPIWKVVYRYGRGSSIHEVATTVRSWTRGEVDALAQVGLQVESLWGDFDESPFRDSSNRIVFVAKSAEVT